MIIEKLKVSIWVKIVSRFLDFLIFFITYVQL